MAGRMKYLVLLMIVVGGVIGFTLPGAKPVAAVATPAQAASSTPASAPASATDPAPADPPQDTVLQRSDNGHFLTIAGVNGQPTHFVVDTGATIVALTEDDARQAHVAFDPGQFTPVGMSASGEIRGQEVMLDDVDLGGKRVDNIHAVVLDGLGVSLLGQNYLRHLDTVSISGDTMTLR
jgi:aspartyl protease family protein